MPIRNKIYVTKSGETHKYIYEEKRKPMSQREHRRKCSLCNEFLKIISLKIKKERIKLGYICFECKKIYLNEQYERYEIITNKSRKIRKDKRTKNQENIYQCPKCNRIKETKTQSENFHCSYCFLKNGLKIKMELRS